MEWIPGVTTGEFPARTSSVFTEKITGIFDGTSSIIYLEIYEGTEFDEGGMSEETP